MKSTLDDETGKNMNREAEEPHGFPQHHERSGGEDRRQGLTTTPTILKALSGAAWKMVPRTIR